MVSEAGKQFLAGLAIFMMLLSGCSTASSGTGTVANGKSSPSSYQSAPAGTVTLAALGWKNGPRERIVLPVGASIDRKVDQGNVITATGAPGMAEAVLKTLTETLQTYGWTITASGNGSLVFSDAGYDGAFTSDSAIWALTIRVKA